MSSEDDSYYSDSNEAKWLLAKRRAVQGTWTTPVGAHSVPPESPKGGNTVLPKTVADQDEPAAASAQPPPSGAEQQSTDASRIPQELTEEELQLLGDKDDADLELEPAEQKQLDTLRRKWARSEQPKGVSPLQSAQLHNVRLFVESGSLHAECLLCARSSAYDDELPALQNGRYFLVCACMVEPKLLCVFLLSHISI